MFGYNQKKMALKAGKIAFIVLAAGAMIYCAGQYLPGVLDYLGNLVNPPCKGPVKVVQTPSGWALTVGGRPFFVKGVAYRYTEVGKGPAFDLYTSVSRPWLVDGELMKRMGANAVSLYGTGRQADDARALIRDLFGMFGIKTALGHDLGFTGAASPDLASAETRAAIRESVLEMVRAYKEEDAVLFWILGNSASSAFTGEVPEESAKAYYSFINELAAAIKGIDRDHPVVMANTEPRMLELARRYAPDVDILGGIAYQGESFGSYFSEAKAAFGRPNVFVEFGADRYDALRNLEAQNWQAAFLANEWREIERNGEAAKTGTGNSLGGFVFEWTDTWWRYNPAESSGWRAHDPGASRPGPAYHFDSRAGNNLNDEWWGVVALDPSGARGGLELRVPTLGYDALRKLWTSPFERFISGAGGFFREIWRRIAEFFSFLRDKIAGLFGGKAPKGPVRVVEKPNGWVLTVGGRPFFVKGVCYHYIEVGKDKDYDMFADKKRPWMVDGALMKQMGVNAVRIYSAGRSAAETRQVIRDLYNRFGIKTAIGHYLGFWEWPPANYADPAFRERIKLEVLDMVKDYKDEDGLLFWILGNENNYSFDRGVLPWSTPEIDALPPLEARRVKAKTYYSYVNELARAIKEIDPGHPVVMGNGEIASIDVAKEYTPDIDILGGIVYQGKTFGTYFERLKRNYGKPNVFVEFGADRYDSVWSQEAEDWQAFFMKLQWLEIWKNRAGGSGAGNSLGGFVFEWQDEWWKHNIDYAPGWRVHDTGANWANSAYYFDAKAGNNMSEEWWGVVGLDPKVRKSGIEKRVPKKAFYVMRELWTGKK